MKTLALALLLVSTPLHAAVLCARARNGEIYEGNLKVRRDACRNYEQAVGVLEGTAVPVQGPPGPPGPQGEPGPATMPKLFCLWLPVKDGERYDSPCEANLGPDAFCVDGIDHNGGETHTHHHCWELAVTSHPLAKCCSQ